MARDVILVTLFAKAAYALQYGSRRDVYAVFARGAGPGDSRGARSVSVRFRNDLYYESSLAAAEAGMNEFDI